MNEPISVIIPALNEAAEIQPVLERAAYGAAELFVVDGGSRDGTAERAAACGARVLAAPPGRAVQMNAGARQSSAPLLLFLHADTLLPRGYDEHVRRILSEPGVCAGAFALGINDPKRVFRLIEAGANWRSRWLQLPYGDQALFLRRGIFEELGRFPDLPLMEDFEFARRLRHRGRIQLAPVSVQTSARRWSRRGVWKTTLLNQVLIAGYCAGVPPKRLARLYYGSSYRPRRP